MSRLRNIAAGLLLTGGPAWAGESLINGQPLEYNHAYACRGERIIVAHCRDNDDSSYCQIVYPDRPYVNGMQVAPVEARGDIIAKISACSAPQKTQVASTARKAPGAAVSTQSKAITPPGLGKSSWLMLSFDDDSGIFFTRAAISHSAKTGTGWFTEVYPRPIDVATISGVKFEQIRYAADCAKSTIQLTGFALYDEDSKQLYAAAVTNRPINTVEHGKLGEAKLNVICGRKQVLIDEQPVVGAGRDIILHYAAASYIKSNRQ